MPSRLPLLLTMVVVVLCSYGVVAKAPTEPPTSYVCDHLMPPPHTRWVIANVTKRRYSIVTLWASERRLYIVMTGNGKTLLLVGAVMQVRLTEQNIPVGQFEAGKEGPVTLYDCPPGRKNTAYSHLVDPVRKIIMYWKVPPDLNSRIHNFTLFATFISSHNVFWPVNMEVTKCEYTKSEMEKLSIADDAYTEQNETVSRDSLEELRAEAILNM